MIIGATSLFRTDFAKSLGVFKAGACRIHHSASSRLLSELSAVPIIAWHRHPYLFSWKFIIYDTSLVGASGDLSAIIQLKWDLIGQLLSHMLLWSFISSKCPSKVPKCNMAEQISPTVKAITLGTSNWQNENNYKCMRSDQETIPQYFWKWNVWFVSYNIIFFIWILRILKYNPLCIAYPNELEIVLFNWWF